MPASKNVARTTRCRYRLAGRIYRRGRRRSTEMGLTGRREVESEIEPGPITRRRLDLQHRSHGLDQLSADGKSQPGTGKGVFARLLPPSERLEEGRHGLRRNTPAGVSNRELDATRVPGNRAYLHRTFSSELERVGGEVKQHPAEGHGMPDAEIGLRRRDLHLQVLLFRNRLNNVPNRFQDVLHREWNGIQIYQTVAAAGQLDHIACHRAEPKGGAVDQAELPFLHRVDRAAATTLQGFRQEQNGREG